jgi:uncharacterized protein with von Willebrand factor type A (vWA) domain
MDELATVAGWFGSLLRAAGIPTTPEQCTLFAQALSLSSASTLDDLATLGKATFVSSHEQYEIFERVFAIAFRGVRPEHLSHSTTPRHDLLDHTEPDGGDGVLGQPMTDDEPSRTRGSTGSAPDEAYGAQVSFVAELAAADSQATPSRNFAGCDIRELRLLEELAEQLPHYTPPGRASGWTRSRLHRRVDVRATLRASCRTVGEPVRLRYQARAIRPRSIILLADTSASMEHYTRIYLRFLRGCVRSLGAEAFVFSTSLSRVTRQLEHPDPDVAFQTAAQAAADWGGGTRIGDSLRTFVKDFGRRGPAVGAVIVIFSDGWEAREPESLRRAMEQLSLMAFKLVWVNPRASLEGYEPLVAGMTTALPYVDRLMTGHSLTALQDLLHEISDYTG